MTPAKKPRKKSPVQLCQEWRTRAYKSLKKYEKEIGWPDIKSNFAAIKQIKHHNWLEADYYQAETAYATQFDKQVKKRNKQLEARGARYEAWAKRLDESVQAKAAEKAKQVETR